MLLSLISHDVHKVEIIGHLIIYVSPLRKVSRFPRNIEFIPFSICYVHFSIEAEIESQCQTLLTNSRQTDSFLDRT